MAKTVLQIKNLSKTIGKKKIVEGVNFDVFAGEIFGLLGPNGAGKTTIIRAIVRLISPTSGTVLINGLDVSISYKEAISDVGAIIENPEFYLYLSGWQNLEQFARASNKKITEAQLTEIVEKVKLTEAIHQKVKTYSLGMRQRLGLAQALLHDPSILILDEPTNGLDPQGMADFRDIIRDVSRRGIAVLISSHLLSEIQQITDRFAIIEKGRLTHIETMKDVEDKAREYYLFKVSNTRAAISVLAAIDIVATLKGEALLQVLVTEEGVPSAVKALVEQDVAIYSVVGKAVSLEEHFLALTEGGSL